MIEIGKLLYSIVVILNVGDLLDCKNKSNVYIPLGLIILLSNNHIWKWEEKC